MSKKIIIITILFSIISIRLYSLNKDNYEYYNNILNKKINNYVYGIDPPRGRILDCNNKVLVDNVGIKSIFYQKNSNISTKDEIDIAYSLAKYIDIEIDLSTLKSFYLLINKTNDLITEDEYNLYKERKITSEDITKMKYERITEEMLNTLDSLDRKASTIYSLMNKGYSYDYKLIYKGISDTAYTNVIEENLPGISVSLIWDRVYNYGDTLKDIFGTIGSISEDKVEEYLSRGYEMNDLVGTSYLELEYDSYLRGKKAIYKVSSDNELVLISPEVAGNDLVLSIDIDAQIKLESIIEENILKAKSFKYTDYFSEAYSIVGDPKTGSIIAMSGRKLVDNKFVNNNISLISSSFTVGSIVKMATISTGYKYGVIDIGTKYRDSCVKLYNIPIKCSYKSLGVISDLEAISKSSNYYQFMIALGITGNSYKYNMKLTTTEDDFNKFRDTFKEYGLGDYTGIDLPNEKIGIIGNNYSSDLLLNLTIGQYDTYTVMELFQYINTVASLGEKRNPALMKEIVNEYKNEYNVVSKVSLDDKYLERLRVATNNTVTKGTARGYIDTKYNGAGKTGTSETFIDTDSDNIMDTKTLSLGFVGYAPYDDPKYSIVVLTPNIYIQRDTSYSKVYITRYISKDIMNFLFENA